MSPILEDGTYVDLDIPIKSEQQLDKERSLQEASAKRIELHSENMKAYWREWHSGF